MPANNNKTIDESKQWWRFDTVEVSKKLFTDASQGLTQQEASLRLSKYGPNQLKEKKAVSPLIIFLDQFKNFIIWILVAAALVSGFLKEWVDAGAIIAIVIINAIMGFIQEYKAEKSLAALKKMSSPSSKAIRDGKLKIVQSKELVIGDIIEVESGDNVPADARIISATSNFSTQEASLTGESVPVHKNTHIITKKDVQLGDRSNMIYMGTSVASGKARAIITETGMHTELGSIAEIIQEIKRMQTPLQRRLQEFGKFIVYIVFLLVAIIFFLNYFRGGKILDIFLTAVSLAVAAIPEGLPAVVTIALALGVQRMVKRNALIRKLPSVETLGSATVICSDKTGTLTKNEMTVKFVSTATKTFQVTGVGYEPTGQFLIDENPQNPRENPDLINCLLCSVLCNGAELYKTNDNFKIAGDPTEGALLTCAAKAGLDKSNLENEYEFVQELPFDSERKKMTIIRKKKQKLIAFVKGAPDVLLKNCTKIEENSKTRELTAKDRENILNTNVDLANQAMRILALAYRDLDKNESKFDTENIEQNLTFVGLSAMIDPPREEVKLAINDCKTAGIKTVMITGDHKNTAVAIAKELKIFYDDSIALSGEELDKLDDETLNAEVLRIPVYARVSPQHKLRTVKALKKLGEVVAMTGDGVNDAPALKEADIGVAMGITGTDVTKEVSDMVITDDNFASIVSAIEEGRGIYDNINKFIHYLLSCNTGEIFVMFIASLVGLPAPLLPIHILWVNLVTDGLPALALGIDPVDKNIMERKPRPPKEPVITKERGSLILAQGGFIALCTLFAFIFVLFYEKASLQRAMTASFIVLSCSQLFHALNCRSQVQSLFKLGVFTNIKLIFAILISLSLQISVVYVPFLQKIFKTVSLSSMDWFMVVIVSSFPLWAMEIVKFIRKKI